DMFAMSVAHNVNTGIVQAPVAANPSGGGSGRVGGTLVNNQAGGVTCKFVRVHAELWERIVQWRAVRKGMKPKIPSYRVDPPGGSHRPPLFSTAALSRTSLACQSSPSTFGATRTTFPSRTRTTTSLTGTEAGASFGA